MTMTFKGPFELEFREREQKGLQKGLHEGLHEGLQEGLDRGRDNALLSLRKVLRRRKTDPSKHEKHFAKLASVGQVVDTAAAVAGAKDPVAYLRRRFAARPARKTRRRPAAARA